MTASLDSQVCAVDGRAFSPHDDIVVCETCGVVCHAHCWDERGKCPNEPCRGTARPVFLLTVAPEHGAADEEQIAAVTSGIRALEVKLDQSLARHQKATFEAITSLRNVVSSAFSDQKDREKRLAARLEDVRMKIRALDLYVTARPIPSGGPSPAMPPSAEDRARATE